MLVLDRLIGLASPEAALRRAVRLSGQGKVAEAFPLLTRSAKAGIAEAEYRVACCYLEGAGVPASRIEGGRWLQRAAGHGHVEAQTLLGGLCVHGLAGDVNGDRAERLFAEEAAGEPDFAAALKWARLAAEAGSAKAQAVLGYVLTCGPEEMRDLDAAHRWYQRSAASSCPEGCLGYALSLAPRTQDEAGRHEVAEHLRRAAEAELPTAIYLLAALTEQGVGVARDPAVAAQLYCHAAERGQRSAQLRWGLALMEGHDVKQDLVLGESWLRRAAEGVPQAQYMYGRMLADGHGIAADPEAARAWIARAAAAGLREAQVALAEMMVNGRGGPRDTAAALELFEKAAAAGHSGAMFALGALYAGGHDLAEDRMAAQYWFRAAAELGHGQAQLMLGRYLAEGAAGEPNPAEARLWFEQAAAQGIEEAQADLAALHAPALQ